MNLASDRLNELQSQNVLVGKQHQEEVDKANERLKWLKQRIGEKLIQSASPYYAAIKMKNTAEAQLRENTERFAAVQRAVESARKTLMVVEEELMPKMGAASSEDETLAIIEELNASNELHETKKRELQEVSDAIAQGEKMLTLATERIKQAEA